MDEIFLTKLHENANIGSISAIFDLVDYYLEKNERDRAFENALRFKYFQDKEGFHRLGYFYEKGIGTAPNIEEAKRYYSLAFALDNVPSSYNLALLYYKEGNLDTCIRYLEYGVMYNHLPSIKMLADFYYQGVRLEKNNEIAINLYQILVKNDKNEFLDHIGKIYYEQKEFGKAFHCFELGQQKGLSSSIYHLGLCYIKGEGTGRNIAKGIELLEQASKLDSPRATKTLLFHYEKEIGVKHSQSKENELRKRLMNQL